MAISTTAFKAAFIAALLVVSIGAVGGPEAAVAPPAGRLVELGIDECANDINDIGTIVTDTKIYARGTFRPLPAGLARASDINNRGQIGGSADGGVPAFWNGSQLIRIPPLPGDDFADISDINDLGQVVGTSGTFGGPLHAFRWRNGVSTRLIGLGESTAATGMNELGQVVGYSWVGDRQQGVRWDRTGRVVPLSGLGDGLGHTLPNNINNLGVATGYSYESASGGAARAVTWDRSGRPTDIDVPGSTLGVGVDINLLGQVVGSTFPPGVEQSGFVWSRPGPAEVLPVSPSASGVMNAINEFGWAVGCEYGPGGEKMTATLWKPAR